MGGAHLEHLHREGGGRQGGGTRGAATKLSGSKLYPRYLAFLSLISLLKISFQGRALITEFQQQKFRHFFYHVLDLNNDHVISQEDFDGIYIICFNVSLWRVCLSGLNSRVRHYMAWGVNSPQYLTLTEVHDHFISYFLHTSAKFVKVSISKFLLIWNFSVYFIFYFCPLFINIFGSTFVSNKEIIALECEKIDILAVLRQFRIAQNNLSKAAEKI